MLVTAKGYFSGFGFGTATIGSLGPHVGPAISSGGSGQRNEPSNLAILGQTGGYASAIVIQGQHAIEDTEVDVTVLDIGGISISRIPHRRFVSAVGDEVVCRT